MRRLRIVHCLLRRLAPPLRTGHDASRAIFGGEIIQQPDRIAHVIIVWLYRAFPVTVQRRSEEHTSELQSRENLVCRLLLEKKKQTTTKTTPSYPRHHLLDTATEITKWPSSLTNAGCAPASVRKFPHSGTVYLICRLRVVSP